MPFIRPGVYRYAIGSKKFGMWLFIISDALTFSAMLAVYMTVVFPPETDSRIITREFALTAVGIPEQTLYGMPGVARSIIAR